MNAIKTERLTIRHIVADDWKSIQEIWTDFNISALSQYDNRRPELFMNQSDRIER